MGPTANQSAETSSCRRDGVAAAKASPIADLVLPVGRRIEIEGREGVFIVLRTDVERGTLDVLRVSGIRQIEAGIPIGSVRVLSGQNLTDPFQNIDG